LCAAALALGRGEGAAAPLGPARAFLADARPAGTGYSLGGYLDSPAREMAILLATLLDVEPDSPQIPVLVERLKGMAQVGRWGTTQENAFALLALGKYARRLGAVAEGEFTVTFPDGTVKTGEARKGLRLDNALPGQSLRVRFAGKGTLHACWSAEGAALDGDVPEVDAGLAVRRTFLETDGKTAADPAALVSGRIYLVDLTVQSNIALKNLVVTDLLPAGVEIEDQNLAGSSRLGVGEGAWLAAEMVERRDDRLLIFGSCGAGGARFRYAVRAVTPGTYVLPAAEAAAMYDPGLYSIHGRGKVVIRLPEGAKP
jgi:hypothetical protein